MLTDATRQRDFPSLVGMTYLNTAAESIPPRCVGDAIQAYWQDKLRGMQGRDAHFATLEACREVSARMLGLATAEVSFCSCSSEAYNLLAAALNLGEDDEVVVNDLDFPAGATPWLRAVERPVLQLWKSRQGALRMEELASLLNARTRLVQVSLVSFFNGHRIDWPKFHELVRHLAPQALIAVDVTQALGRVVLDCSGADIMISSTHKWTLGIHGGCIVGIPKGKAAWLTTHAGGWFHLENAFDADRFQRAVPKTGAASFSVGMPNFVALYALNAGLRYLEEIGVAAISRQIDPLIAEAEAGLRALGLTPMAEFQPKNPSGILAFQHAQSSQLHGALEQNGLHVMHSAGRIRLALHGYNTAADVAKFLGVLRSALPAGR